MITTRRRFRRALPALVLTACALLGACASDDGADEPRDEPSSSSTPALSDEALEGYFVAVASFDPDLLAAARESTKPGSNADTYAGYLEAVSTSAIEGGSPIDPSDVKAVADGYTACGGTGDPASCATWSDIEVVDGALVDFTVNGQSLDGRLVAGDGSVTDADGVASVEFLYAYQSPQSGTQFVAVLISAESVPVQIGGDSATYVGPDGTEYASAGARGAGSVAAGESVTVVMPFENAPTAGTANLSLAADGADPVSVVIDTAP